MTIKPDAESVQSEPLFNDVTINYVKMILFQLNETLQNHLLRGKPIRPEDVESMISFIECLFDLKEDDVMIDMSPLFKLRDAVGEWLRLDDLETAAAFEMTESADTHLAFEKANIKANVARECVRRIYNEIKESDNDN